MMLFYVSARTRCLILRCFRYDPLLLLTGSGQLDCTCLPRRKTLVCSGPDAVGRWKAFDGVDMLQVLQHMTECGKDACLGLCGCIGKKLLDHKVLENQQNLRVGTRIGSTKQGGLDERAYGGLVEFSRERSRLTVPKLPPPSFLPSI